MDMSELAKSEGNPQEPQWQIEEFYFGLGEWSAYRRSGEQIQYRVEKGLPLTLREGTHQYDASADEVAEFLAEFEDCQFIVADSYELNSGGRQAPYLWVMGWKDLSDEERRIYEENKAYAWKKPDEG
ncbi:MAG: hypothetical protein JWS12_442 [Candidatus Saccharibacteria bacterium]|nr:hypothetical protein [Candidatus Saccharibacteria bacterium]